MSPEHLLGSTIQRKLSFTGSVPVGIHLQQLAAKNMIRCTMELGGHSPVMVFKDADIDACGAAMRDGEIPQCRSGMYFTNPLFCRCGGA
jgi:succinate-semialdehyde dehydrogenase/glutarate-semialdehyde dehydrogenase